MSSMNQDNPSRVARPGPPSSSPSGQVGPEADGWTVVSKPGAAVEISTRPLPDRVREAIARNLGVGTGVPDER